MVRVPRESLRARLKRTLWLHSDGVLAFVIAAITFVVYVLYSAGAR